MKKFLLMAAAAILMLSGCDKVKKAVNDALDTGTDVIIDESGVKSQGISCPDAYQVVFRNNDNGTETPVQSYRDGDVCKASAKGFTGDYAISVSGKGTKDSKQYTLSASAEHVVIAAGVLNCRLVLSAQEVQ